MRNAIVLTLILSLPISEVLAAKANEEIQKALNARTELLRAIDTAAYMGGHCKDRSRVAMNEMRHQDRLNERVVGEANPQFWSHARYAYESSLRRLQQNRCAVK